jgi:diaminohydroxyphosphoribosylaminopyrimidine deaminase/5-amino-6-(5-phosphoribosylamino)uracil reductase
VAELVECPVAESGLDPNWILRDLARRQVLHLLVEGGGRVASTFLENSLVDEAYLFYAPKVAGDPKARAAFSGLPGKMLADWTTGRLLAVRNLSGNILARISFESSRDV